MLPSEFRFIERGWFNGNSVLIVGDGKPVIVDTGHVTAVPETLSLIQQAGVAPESIQHIVTTHCHSDHHGANATLKQLSGATIGMGQKTAVFFAKYDYHNIWASYLGQEVELVPADVVYEHGDRITLLGLPFEIIHTPGHAPDAISLYQPDYKLLICADAVWENDVSMLNTAVHPDAIAQTELAIERLSQYDIAITLPGHGGPIWDISASFAAAKQRLARFRRDPIHLAWHFTRRILMFQVLRFQPITFAALRQITVSLPWMDDYAPLCGYQDKKQLFDDGINDFIQRGLVVENEGELSSQLPR
ncbi:MAG: MBL fold metallo-hydrolase [Chloroflexota bacterium]